jgi:nucleotide-binding universal stress UspA family protein
MKTILAALDFSDVTDRVVEVASSLARVYGATLYLLHVEPPEPDFVGYEPGPQHVRELVAAEAIRHFKEEHTLRDRLREEGLDVQSLVIQGAAADKILEEAERLSADLIAVGSHGHGAVYHILLGSVGEGVVKRATCPVLVVPMRAETG